MGDVSEITVKQQRMSSMLDIMDADETVDWIERRSAAVAEWAYRTMCQKEHWDTDGPGVTSEEKHGRPSAKATEPGRGKARRILDLKNEDKGEFPPNGQPIPFTQHRIHKN